MFIAFMIWEMMKLIALYFLSVRFIFSSITVSMRVNVNTKNVKKETIELSGLYFGILLNYLIIIA